VRLQQEIEQAITSATGEKAHIVHDRTANGGCINNSRIISLKDGRLFFIKSLPGITNYPGIFTAEFKGLELLAAAGAIRIPKPLVCNQDYIVLEMFQESDKPDNWNEKLGRQLAQLHLSTMSDSYGFEMDNYLGITPQPNTWASRWLDFWRDQRLGWQLELFSRKTGVDDKLLKLGDRIMPKLNDFLGAVTEPAVLLHGDLWSGNAAADESGEPIIYDPACYYGHREAEFGIMRMFGGFGARCEAAYNEVWPWEEGVEERSILYQLYHELNHLNLFGKTYYQSCINSLKLLV
jgi:protein-ribulosamine 3-kinase